MITEKVTSFIPDAIREAGNTIAAAIQGGSGGSSVEWSQIITTGTKIATITIDEESTDVYAPAGGGGSTVSWNEIQQSGTKIAEITIDGTTYDVYAPNVSVSAADVSYNNTTSGLTATDAQEAIDELDAGIDTISGTVSGHTADIGNLQSAVASKTDQSMIAPVETVATASQAYAIGEQFILNGTLYTATAAITAGGTITVDGNCTASDTVTEQIDAKFTSNVLTGVSTKYTIPSEIRYQKNRYVTYMGKFTFLNLTIVCVTPTSSSEAVVSGLPNPIDDFDNTFIISAPSMDATSQILCFLQNGILYVLGGDAGKTYKLSTFYPSK